MADQTLRDTSMLRHEWVQALIDADLAIQTEKGLFMKNITKTVAKTSDEALQRRLAQILDTYPKRRGPNSLKPALARLVHQIRNLDDPKLLEFENALENYRAYVAENKIEGTKFVKMMTTFVSEKEWPIWVGYSAFSPETIDIVEKIRMQEQHDRRERQVSGKPI